jgi:hypothetical protein
MNEKQSQKKTRQATDEGKLMTVSLWEASLASST